MVAPSRKYASSATCPSTSSSNCSSASLSRTTSRSTSSFIVSASRASRPHANRLPGHRHVHEDQLRWLRRRDGQSALPLHGRGISCPYGLAIKRAFPLDQVDVRSPTWRQVVLDCLFFSQR